MAWDYSGAARGKRDGAAARLAGCFGILAGGLREGDLFAAAAVWEEGREVRGSGGMARLPVCGYGFRRVTRRPVGAS